MGIFFDHDWFDARLKAVGLTARRWRRRQA